MFPGPAGLRFAIRFWRPPTFKAILNLPEPAKIALAGLLDNLSKFAEAKAEASWLKKKGPMACYWKACAVYSQHISRAIRKSCRVVVTTDNEKLTTPGTLTIPQTFEANNENQNASARAA